jgi:hypothetical protein
MGIIADYGNDDYITIPVNKYTNESKRLVIEYYIYNK